ncbi:MAG: hypothetical protein R3200_01575 [Xanthomonadales bacterium]|nr:hypothetical protein [Xanthomonadales bacterium]
MNEKWLERARTSLEDGSRSIPGETASRLNQARQRALNELDARRVAPRWWAGAALASLLAVGLAIGIWLDSSPDPAPVPVQPAASPLADLDVLTAVEDLEMLADLEFYLWLDENWAEDAG